MASNQVLRRENDFVLQKLTLTAYNGSSYDITKLYTTFTFEENIFQATVHGSVSLFETIDLPGLMPLIGEETIEAQFTRPDIPQNGEESSLLDPIYFKAKIYKMSSREVSSTSDKSQNYTLFFASEELFKSAQKKVNQGFKATKISDIVKEIFDQYLKEEKELEIEETKFDVDYVISNKSPILAIRELAERAISTEGSALYTFFEDRDKFYFKSVDSLIDQEPEKEIKYRVQNVLEKGDNYQDRTIEQDMESVQHYHHNSTFDIFDSLKNGKAAARLITVDLIRQKFQTKDFDLSQEFDNFKHLGQAKNFTSGSKLIAPEACVSLQFTQSESSLDPTQKAKMIEEYHLKRESQKKQIISNVTSVSLSGDPRYKAGQVIEFILPELMGKVSREYPQELDKYLQGKYLVASCSHIVKQNSYYTNMELVKDSFFSEIEHRDLLEEVDPQIIF